MALTVIAAKSAHSVFFIKKSSLCRVGIGQSLSPPLLRSPRTLAEYISIVVIRFSLVPSNT
jgi:hypothetical protein